MIKCRVGIIQQKKSVFVKGECEPFLPARGKQNVPLKRSHGLIQT